LNLAEQRVAEASALRRFFHEQWETLQQLLHEYRQEQLQREQEEQAISGAVESIVEGTDRRLRLVSDYKDALRASAGELLTHIEELVSALPPALAVSKGRLTTDPLVRRLIRSRDNIELLFRRNPQVQQFFADPRYSQCEEVFGLLSLLRYEKTVLGSEVRGDIIMREVRQTLVNFTGRELLAPRPSEAEARNAVRQLLFDGVINHAKRQILYRRAAQSKEEQLQAQLHPEQHLNNPEVYLRLLTELLSEPRQLLRLNNDQIHINSLDVRLPHDQGSSSDTLELFEVGVGNEHSRVISLVRYPRAEFAAL
jgi:hypothetical protein